MIESIVTYMQGLPVWGVVIFAFLVAWVENLLPPAPSDVLLAFCGSLVGFGTVDFTTLLLVATTGSVAGFATAYWLGRTYKQSLINARWLPFITQDLVDTSQKWFDKYHGAIIVANRFMAGTRAVISFAAGMTNMPFPRTTLYCAVSAAAWNALLIWGGMLLGTNWRNIDGYVGTYGWVITALIVAIVAIVVIRRKRRRTSALETPVDKQGES